MELPPVLQIAISEELWKFGSPHQLARSIKADGLGGELHRQALWSQSNFEYDSIAARDLPSGFLVAPSVSLNPFSPAAKCSNPQCRAVATEDFVKTVGLYADVAFVQDPLSVVFAREKKITSAESTFLYQAVQALRQLAPLIEAGVVRFVDPFHHYCRECHAKLSDSIESAAESLLSEARLEIDAEIIESEGTLHVFVEAPLLYPSDNHPLITHFKLSGRRKEEFAKICGAGPRARRTRACRGKLADLMRDRLREELRHVLFDLEASRDMRALLLAGSRLEPLFISRLEKSAPVIDDLENWERLRTLNLPWIHELSAEEVLRLREEAHLALPRLREMLGRRLNTPGSGDTEKVREVVSEIREQAAEVEAELMGLELARERKYRTGMGGLSMLFVVYAFASGVPQLEAGSIGALLATLAHLRGTERAQAAELAKLSARPAFALIKAKRMIQERRRAK